MFARSQLVLSSVLLVLTLSCSTIQGQPPKKSVGVNLFSKWSQTPLYLEAAEFFAEEGNDLLWQYVNALRPLALERDASSKPLSPKEQYELVEQVTDRLLPVAFRPLLRFTLSLRSYSPTIAMFNQIALQALDPKHLTCSNFVELSTLDSTSESFSRIHCDATSARAALELLQKQPNALLTQPNIYKLDHPHPGAASGDQSRPTAILYGDLLSKAFFELFDQLKPHAESGAITLYYRPYVPTESNAEQVSLSGYGIELQIKSTEYKAQDDTRVKGEEGQLTKQLLKKDSEQSAQIDGIDFGKLTERHPEQEEKLNKLLDYWIEASKEIATLKIWELQDLSLQAAKKVLQAPKSEQLRLLQDVAQNFPVYAKSLVKIAVEPELRKEIEKNQQYFMQQLNIGIGDTALFINGMFFDLDSVDVFTLTHFLRQETRLLSGLHRALGDDRTQISSLLRLDVNEEKHDYQIDIRDSSIIYVNDIENDRMYRNWPGSIQDLLRPTYPGMLRNVRKNLYHLVLIVDPSKRESFDLIKLAESFYMHKAPLRIGFVFAVNSDKSVDGFRDAGVACLNAFNYIAQEATAPEALSFLTDLIATVSPNEDITSDQVVRLLKTRHPKAKADFVFGEDSEYDSGRVLAWDFLNRTAIGKPVQVLLNGVLLKEVSHI
jgi:UDP-glucose:glycoprotein glucosyltransferase